MKRILAVLLLGGTLIGVLTGWVCNWDIYDDTLCVTVTPICPTDCAICNDCWKCGGADLYNQNCRYAEGAMWENCDDGQVAVTCTKFGMITCEMCASLTPKKVVVGPVLQTQTFQCWRVDGGNYCS
jgi:hypothetical protein